MREEIEPFWSGFGTRYSALSVHGTIRGAARRGRGEKKIIRRGKYGCVTNFLSSHNDDRYDRFKTEMLYSTMGIPSKGMNVRTAAPSGPVRADTATPGTPGDRALVYRPFFHAILISIVCVLAYSNTFNVPFQFDDVPNIVDNRFIRDPGHFLDPSGPPGGIAFPSVKRRIVPFLTFALNHAMHGLDITGYHIVNLLIHLINALLVYLLVRVTFETPRLKRPVFIEGWRGEIGLTALFASLFFAAHPVQTQAVTYIVQRMASLAAMFCLLSTVLYAKARLSRSGTRGRILLALCVISAVLAMKSKETAFTLPFVITMYEFMFFEGKAVKRLIRLSPVIITLFVIPLSLPDAGRPLGEIIGTMSDATRVQTDMSRLDYLFTQFRVIATYVRLFFIPVNQNLDYDYRIYRPLLDRGVLASLFLLLSIAATGGRLLYRFMRRGAGRPASDKYLPLISFGIFWFFVFLSVESGIIPIRDVIYEHRLYLPSAGASVAVISSLFIFSERLKRTRPGSDKAFTAVLVVAIIALAGATYARNRVWGDEISLWEDVVKKSPHKVRGHYNLGNGYRAGGRPFEAVKHYKTVLRLDPSNVEAHNNLGVVYAKLKKYSKAVEHYRLALRRDPAYEEARFNLGVLYVEMGASVSARGEFETLLRINPLNERARRFLRAVP